MKVELTEFQIKFLKDTLSKIVKTNTIYLDSDQIEILKGIKERLNNAIRK